MTDENEIEIHPVTDACFGTERLGLIGGSDCACLFGQDDNKTLARMTASPDSAPPSLMPSKRRAGSFSAATPETRSDHQLRTRSR